MERGNGISNEREVDKRRDVCELEVCVCVKLYRSTVNVSMLFINVGT